MLHIPQKYVWILRQDTGNWWQIISHKWSYVDQTAKFLKPCKLPKKPQAQQSVTFPNLDTIKTLLQVWVISSRIFCKPIKKSFRWFLIPGEIWITFMSDLHGSRNHIGVFMFFLYLDSFFLIVLKLGNKCAILLLFFFLIASVSPHIQIYISG